MRQIQKVFFNIVLEDDFPENLKIITEQAPLRAVQ